MANTKMWTLTGWSPVPFYSFLSFSVSCPFQFLPVLLSLLLSFDALFLSQFLPVLSSNSYVISLSSVFQPYFFRFFVYFLKKSLNLSSIVYLHDTLFRFVNIKRQILAETNDNIPWQSIFNTIFEGLKGQCLKIFFISNERNS
jgi:hypothetical protein